MSSTEPGPGDDRPEENEIPADEKGDVRSQDRTPEDPVDAETKELANDEAEQHDSAAEAQKTNAEETGGYGH